MSQNKNAINDINRKGLTLIELILSTLMLTMILGITVFIFQTVLQGWSKVDQLTGINVPMKNTLELLTRDLRKAKQILAVNDEIRFTLDETTYYILYLYHGNDTYPLNFNQEKYALKKAVLTGGINGTFTYGDGTNIMNNIMHPPITDLSIIDNKIGVDVSIQPDQKIVRKRIEVIPRNL